MRRSLLAPALIALAVFAFTVLPGNLLFWLGYLIGALATPFLIALIQTLLAQRFAVDRVKRYTPVILGLKAALLQLLITFEMLPYQASLMLSAISITLGRVLFTHKNMLVWVTSADVEKAQKSTFHSYIGQMWLPALGVYVLPLAAALLKPEALLPSFCIALVWSLAPFIAYAISREPGGNPPPVKSDDARMDQKLAFTSNAVLTPPAMHP